MSKKEISGVLEGKELATKLEEATLSLSGICSQINFLQGKILTIIDASISDKVQNKAIKDLIKTQFYEQMNWITKISTGHYGLVGVKDDSEIEMIEKGAGFEIIKRGSGEQTN